MKNPNKTYYTIEDMQGDLLEIIRLINEDGWVADNILAIGRGGYIPGVYLSQWLKKPLYTYHYSLRDMNRSDEFTHDLVTACTNKKILVIDDICDNGNTFKIINQLLDQLNCESKFACLIYNIGEKNFEPDYWGLEINKREKPEWIVYPWEEWHRSKSTSN